MKIAVNAGYLSRNNLQLIISWASHRADDRFLFINELFRGDEAMYERSIKTIQGFSIFAEAEFWIRRELKVKIGWHDNHPIVKQFDQLIKRRFS